MEHGANEHTDRTARFNPVRRWITDLLHDMRLSWRNTRRAPIMSAIVVMTAALGIAAVATVFSFVNTIWVRPYPYPDSDRLATPVFVTPDHYVTRSIPTELLHSLRMPNRAWVAVGSYDEQNALIVPPGGGEAQQVYLTQADGSLFTMLGATPVKGRLISTREMAERASVVLVSDSLWRVLLGSRELDARTTLRVDGIDRTVVGVMPRAFHFPRWSDVWIPLADSGQRAIAADLGKDRSGHRPAFQALIHLRPGVSRDAANAEVRLLSERLARTDSFHLKGWRAESMEGMFPRVPQALWALAALFFTFTGLVLIVACANIANILLAQSVARRGEFAVRAALGASRERLMRQILGEHVVLGVAAAVLGIPLTALGVQLVLHATPLPPMGLPSYLQFGVDWRVFAFACGTAALAIILFGLTPAREGGRVDPMHTIKSASTNTGTSRAGAKEGRRLVVIQLALSLVLLISGAVTFRAFRELSGLAPGYPTDRLLEVPMYLNALGGKRYAEDSARSQFARRMGEQLAHDARVEQVAYRGFFDGFNHSGDPKRGDRVFDPANPKHQVEGAQYGRFDMSTYSVSRNYFATRQSPLVAGRLFEAGDSASTPHVAVITTSVAKAFWGDGTAIGRQLQIGASGPPFTIVGVVRSPVHARFGPRDQSIEALREIFFTEEQSRSRGTSLLVLARASADSAHDAKLAIQASAQTIDPDARFLALRTIAEEDALNLMPLRLLSSILTVLAGIGVGLSLLGLYGLTSFVVAQRTKEIGIRAALGATATHIMRLVLSGALRLILVGLGAGLTLTFALGLLARTILPGLRLTDVATYGVSIASLAVVAIAACMIPARRAALLEPTEALRS